MTDLLVRKLLIDLDSPFHKHWCNGDAFLSAWFDALSMSFPIGEQFFIDSVRTGFSRLPPEKQKAFESEVKGFIGQEATHRHLHAKFNQHLANQGLPNEWEGRAKARLAPLSTADIRHSLAITAANEHFTALFAHWLLTHPECLQETEPRLRYLWEWHSAEESEHRCTAFDLYQALDGSHEWRVKWMRRITVIFLTDVLRQTAINLKASGELWRISTWRSAWRFLLGKRGLLRTSYGAWREYFRRDFHPSEGPDEPARAWLDAHSGLFRTVNSPA